MRKERKRTRKKKTAGNCCESANTNWCRCLVLLIFEMFKRRHAPFIVSWFLYLHHTLCEILVAYKQTNWTWRHRHVSDIVIFKLSLRHQNNHGKMSKFVNYHTICRQQNGWIWIWMCKFFLSFNSLNIFKTEKKTFLKVKRQYWGKWRFGALHDNNSDSAYVYTRFFRKQPKSWQISRKKSESKLSWKFIFRKHCLPESSCLLHNNESHYFSLWY